MTATVLDLFCGFGGSTEGMGQAGFDVVHASNHWDLAIKVHGLNHPDTEHSCADISRTDPHYYPTTDVLWASPECFPAGALTLTRRGLLPIEDVVVGDEVFTHLHRWREVTAVMEKVSDTVIVRGHGHAQLETTAEHPFYARATGRVWDNSIRQYRRSWGARTWTPAGELGGFAWATPTTYGEALPIPAVGGRGMEFGTDFWWIVGRWLADGVVRIERNELEPLPPIARRRSQPAGSTCIVCELPARPNGNSSTGRVSPYCSDDCKRTNSRKRATRTSRGEVQICCGKHKEEELRKRLDALAPPEGDSRADSASLRWSRKEARTAIVFTTGHLGLAEWLVAEFGRHAHGKTVPAWALAMDPAWRRALLDGYLSGDGSFGRVTKCSSVSKRLAVGVRLLALSLGHDAQLRSPGKRTTGVIEGRTVSMRPIWTVGWTAAPSDKHARTVVEDDVRWAPVARVTPGRKAVTVYNLSVRDDESYLIDGQIVHNCTNHSVAKGVKRVTGQMDVFGEDGPDPAAERSRATMWDVPRFVEAMLMRGKPYRAVVVENVVDAVRWMYWPAWLAAMDAAGYDHHVVYLNSAFAHGKDYGWLGAPQYRDRIYVVFWRKGATAPDLDIRPPGWCPCCEKQVDAVQSWKRPFETPWGRYRAQYTYRCPACRGEVEPFALPAAAAINWDDLGGVIGDRDRPLAKATRERIRAGLARYGRPLMAPAGGTWNDEARPVDEPMRARTTRETEGIACPPMVVPVEGRDGIRARPAGEPMRTQTARLTNSMVVPEAFLAVLRQHVRATGVDGPLTTVSANGNHHGLVVPPGFVMRNNNSSGGGDDGGMCTSFGEPVRAITTKGHQSVVTVPDALLSAYYGNGNCSHVASPVPTLSTRDRFALIARATGSVPDSEVDGCTFRMLEPAEIGAAMAFPGSYRVVGTKRDRVKGFGNAVVPPCARLIAERVLAALAADR